MAAQTYVTSQKIRKGADRRYFRRLAASIDGVFRYSMMALYSAGMVFIFTLNFVDEVDSAPRMRQPVLWTVLQLLVFASILFAGVLYRYSRRRWREEEIAARTQGLVDKARGVKSTDINRRASPWTVLARRLHPSVRAESAGPEGGRATASGGAAVSPSPQDGLAA